jgi:hypothetical protein
MARQNKELPLYREYPTCASLNVQGDLSWAYLVVSNQSNDTGRIFLNDQLHQGHNETCFTAPADQDYVYVLLGTGGGTWWADDVSIVPERPKPAVLNPAGEILTAPLNGQFDASLRVQTPEGVTWACGFNASYAGTYSIAPNLLVAQNCTVRIKPVGGAAGARYAVPIRIDYTSGDSAGTIYHILLVDVIESGEPADTPTPTAVPTPTPGPTPDPEGQVLGAIVGSSTSTFFVGDVITTDFAITNPNSISITLDELVLGGRRNGINDCSNYVNGAYPDFSNRITNVTFGANETKSFPAGTFTPQLPGNYEFQIFYRVGTQWTWNISTPREMKILFSTSGLTGDQLSIAQTYNRIGDTLQAYNDQHDMEIEVALAVWNAESSGLSFKPTANGIPIRFENHKFWEYWGEKGGNSSTYKKHFWPPQRYVVSGHRVCISDDCRPYDPTKTEGENVNWKFVHPYGDVRDQSINYDTLEKANQLAGSDKEQAYRSISMGGPQILGASHDLLPSFNNATDMYTKFSANEINQVIGFFEFMENKTYGGQTAIEWAIDHNNNFDGLAGAYNGGSNISSYSPKICAGYNAARQLFSKSAISC